LAADAPLVTDADDEFAAEDPKNLVAGVQVLRPGSPAGTRPLATSRRCRPCGRPAMRRNPASGSWKVVK
jgi:hypothetical protein